MTSEFVAEWKRLLAAPGSGKKEIAGEYPVRIVYGTNENGAALFFVITDAKPGLPELSRVVNIERGIRTIDGKWTLSLTLVDALFMDVFMRLIEDLVRRLGKATSEAQAINYLLAGIDEWRHLLRNQGDDRLPLEAIRGLVAELWFGFRLLSNERSGDEVVDAWTGPLGSPQDFNFPLGPSYEVKSVHPDSKAITVSSAEQLDVVDHQLSLAVVTLVQVAASVPGSITLRLLVEEAASQFRSGSNTIDEFHRRLDALRVDVSDSYYSDFCFVVSGCRQFEVTDNFPAIRGSLLEAGIDRVTYSVSLSSISEFEIDPPPGPASRSNIGKQWT
ncbi:PD-(D/E)XK motif protein [Leifsonia sp. A12D58]|uniref:PD-(D/E)XK motif protein n=1 Tax=Leifsonia sp. A12D58 TaxID=3397674 RepID=UPI0039DF40A7